MSAPEPSLSVWVDDDFACVKIVGRAACPHSVAFRRLMLGLREKGYGRFVLDLTDCQFMDSTFLGVMAWLVLQFSEANGRPPARIELLNPSARINDLLDNLGVAQLFHIQSGPPMAGGPAKVLPSEGIPDRAEVSRTSLEAHQLLCRLDPKNTARFKDVCQFLKDDLEKLAQKNGVSPAPSEVVKPG